MNGKTTLEGEGVETPMNLAELCARCKPIAHKRLDEPIANIAVAYYVRPYALFCAPREVSLLRS